MIRTYGLDADIGEAEWGQRASEWFGASRGVDGAGSLRVTLVGSPLTSTTVQVAPGIAYGDGTVTVIDDVEQVTLARPETGTRYDCIALRRDWTANRATIVVVVGGSSRIVPPLTDRPGDVTEQALALVTVPSEGGAVISDDLRVTWAAAGNYTSPLAAAPVGSRLLTADGHRKIIDAAGTITDEWTPPQPVIPPVPKVASGVVALTFAADGTAQIPHGLGYAPSRVMLEHATAGTSSLVHLSLTLQAGAVNDRYFAINAKRRTSTGWTPYVGNLSQVTWTAWTPAKQATIPGTIDVPDEVDDAEPTTPVTSGGGSDQVPRDADVAPAPQIPVPETPPIYQVTSPTVSSVSSILATASREIGVRESPAGSNNVKYWLAEKPSWNGNPWCACFTRWVYRRNGILVDTVLGITNPYYTPTLEAGAKRKGLWYTGTPRPGDMVIYGGSANTHAVHVEIVERWLPDIGRVQTIGGNTSDGLTGSASNGGGVWRNRRHPKSSSLPVRGYIRMPTATPVTLQARGPFPLPSGHYYGVADSTTTLDHNGSVQTERQGVMQIQAEVGVVIDGDYGPATKAAVEKWQAAQFLTVTGRVTANDWLVLTGVYRAPTSAPTNVQVTAGVKSVTVAFTGVTGAQQYTVSTSSGRQATAAASPITVTGLTPGVPVTVTVAASNVGGAGPLSPRSSTVWPTEGTLSTIGLLDGTVFPVWSGSSWYGALVGQVATDIKDTVTHGAFTSAFPAARWTPGVQQAARNVAAVLHGPAFAGADGPPVLSTVTFSFTGDTFRASVDRAARRITFGRGVTGATNTAAYVTLAVARLLQRWSTKYGTDAATTAVIDGIAHYALIRIGHHGPTSRPAGGGGSWRDGGDTTGWFLHWIAHEAELADPDYVRRLNQSISDGWTLNTATGVSGRGLTLDQLWAEYKASMT